MVSLLTYDELLDIADNPVQMRAHLSIRLSAQAYDRAYYGGRDVNEYYIERCTERWEADLLNMDNVYDMVAYALDEDPDNAEAEVWRNFLS